MKSAAPIIVPVPRRDTPVIGADIIQSQLWPLLGALGSQRRGAHDLSTDGGDLASSRFPVGSQAKVCRARISSPRTIKLMPLDSFARKYLDANCVAVL